jgi:predicted HAD superfamily hydrolase
MMTEQEYAVNSFTRSYDAFGDRKIILYGLGKNTQAILEACEEYPIIGLLDTYRRDGELYGKPIYPLEAALQMAPISIVIVARPASVKVIANRIAPFCKAHDILLFDLHGNDLLSMPESVAQDDPYFELTADCLKDAIRSHDIISFDVFDTLLARKVLRSQDVFGLVASRFPDCPPHFVELRQESERVSSRNSPPNLHEIYGQIARLSGISSQSAALLMEHELAVERDVVCRRDEMVSVLEFALSLGKPVYLLSDMYLPKPVLCGLLEDRDIRGYRDLMVSCDYRTEKRQGLYQVFKNKAGRGSYLHIGDDEEADGLFAVQHGLDSFLIKKPSEMLELSAWRGLANEADSTHKAVRLGMLAASAFRDPFCLYHSKGKPPVKSSYELGYRFVAPMISGFISWLISQLDRDKPDYVLFLSRDGYLLKKLYDIHYGVESIKSVYLRASRTALNMATIFSQEDIRYAANLPFSGSPLEMLEKRFFLNKDDIILFDDHKFVDVQTYVIAHEPVILERSGMCREAYLRYWRGLGIKRNSRVAIVDFVSAGSCQAALERLLDRQVQGYYLARVETDDDRKNCLCVKSFHKSSTAIEGGGAIWESYLFVEVLLKEPVPPLLYFGSNDVPVYALESYSADQTAYTEQAQKGIVDYCMEYDKIAGYCQSNDDPAFSDAILKMMQRRYSRGLASFPDGAKVWDYFVNREICVTSLPDIE